MKLFNFNIKKLFLIISIFFMNNNYSFSDDVYESFQFNTDFKEVALVTDYNDYLNGVVEIISLNEMFGKFNSLKLYKFKEENTDMTTWIHDRLEYEVKYIGDIERILRSPDSPLNDSVFEYAKSNLPLIDETIKKAAFEPLWFCENIKKAYNKEGEYYQLYCKFPLGMFKYYMILRLQRINKIHYYKILTAINNKRFSNIIDIADSFELK